MAPGCSKPGHRVWRALSAGMFPSAGGRCSADNAHLYVYIFFLSPEVSFALVYGVWCMHPDA